jgi:hypothetical protein
MQSTVQFSSKTIAHVQRLGRAQSGLRVQLLRAVDQEDQLTVSHIQQRYLSKRGPDTLGVVSNRLRGSLWASKARVIGGMIVASIGSNVVYLAPHEYGFDGPIQVRAFTRRDSRRNVYRVQVGTRAALFERLKSWETRKAKRLAPAQKIFEMKTGRILEGGGKLVAQGIVRVKAHTRHAHFAERAPLRRGIGDRTPALQLALERAAVAYLGGQS